MVPCCCEAFEGAASALSVAKTVSDAGFLDAAAGCEGGGCKGGGRGYALPVTLGGKGGGRVVMRWRLMPCDFTCGSDVHGCRQGKRARVWCIGQGWRVRPHAQAVQGANSRERECACVCVRARGSGGCDA